MTITKVQDSISVLITLQAAINECFEIIKKEKEDKQSVVHALADAQLLMFVNSFLDEWEILGEESVRDQRVIKVRKIAAPLVNQIKRWSDLNLMRNTLIAHNFRDRTGRNILLYGYDHELKAPNGFPDRIVLCKSIYLMVQILLRECTGDYNELIKYLKTVKKPIVAKGIDSEQEAAKIVDALVEECNEIATKLDKQN